MEKKRKIKIEAPSLKPSKKDPVVVVGTPSVNRSALNIMEAINLESSRLVIEARKRPLDAQEMKKLQGLSNILVDFSREEREARKQAEEELEKLDPKEFENKVKEALDYASKNLPDLVDTPQDEGGED